MWFLDFVTVFKEIYKCKTSHNLGRNQLPKPLLLPLEFFIFNLIQLDLQEKS